VVKNRGMGLRAWWKAVRSEPDVVWVPGTFEITSASTPAFGARMSSGTWTGVLSGQGFPPKAMSHSDIAPRDRWPAPGQVIPVTFVPTAPELIKFTWSEVSSLQSDGLRGAQALIDERELPPKDSPGGSGGTP
jgi:hypothetical protein